MKQVILVRHAKSSWSDFSIKDFDRPLNDRGKHDAPMMAQRLVDRKIAIDSFIASPAKRAKRTAEYFAKTYGQPKDSVLFEKELYLGGPPTFYEVISRIPDSINSVAIFSHNNGITEFANQLTRTKIDEIPTCGIYAVKIAIETWKDFKEAEKEFWFFDYPKAG
ncbi:MAG: histidine phosphatase family protein [Chitinophagaceae bacterium]